MMTSVRILQPVIVGGAPRKRGVIIDVQDSDARLLIAAKRAEAVEPKPLEVVVTDPPYVPKRRGRPKKAKEEAVTSSKTQNNELVDDASSSI